jgi:hypothetical protein
MFLSLLTMFREDLHMIVDVMKDQKLNLRDLHTSLTRRSVTFPRVLSTNDERLKTESCLFILNHYTLRKPWFIIKVLCLLLNR